MLETVLVIPESVCVEVTRAFLEFSRFRGNDLSTPMPEYNFPGLQPGERVLVQVERR